MNNTKATMPPAVLEKSTDPVQVPVAAPLPLSLVNRQTSIFEPGEIEKQKAELRAKQNTANATAPATETTHTKIKTKTSAGPSNLDDSYRTSLYANRASIMNRHCNKKHPTKRSSFNTTTDIGKDHQRTKRESFFGFFGKVFKDDDKDYSDSEDEDSHRLFHLSHWFAGEKDPYASTYKRNEKEVGLDSFVAACVMAPALIIPK